MMRGLGEEYQAVQQYDEAIGPMPGNPVYARTMAPSSSFQSPVLTSQTGGLGDLPWYAWAGVAAVAYVLFLKDK